MELHAIKLKIYQDLVSYKTPVSFQLRESYPLPPYSTVIGMVHKACGYTKYEPMQVSVQGSYFSKTNNFQTAYFFKPGKCDFDKCWKVQDKLTGAVKIIREKKKLDENKQIILEEMNIPRGQIFIEDKDNNTTAITKGTTSFELLTDVELILHIKPDNPDKLGEICQCLQNPDDYISLGRREDICRVDEIKKVNIRYSEFEKDTCLSHNCYIPIEQKHLGKIRGTIYDLNTIYSTDNKNNFRSWQKQKTVYASAGNTIIFADEILLIDDENDLVFFAGQKNGD